MGKEMKRKVLISYGFGAGWSSWNSGETAKFMLTYKPIIDFIEAGNKFTREDAGDIDGNGMHPLLKQLQDDCLEKFNDTYVCVLGARGLALETVYGLIKVDEYDGYESYISRDDDDGWY